MENVYMTIPEMQSYLRISRKTAYKLAASGKIPTYRVSPRKILVRKVDVDKFVAAHKG